MDTREHIHEETFPATQEEVFALLHAPSAIREWWSAARAIVLPEVGGTWAAAWGDEEDCPDYMTFATITVFDPPHRLRLSEYRYWARRGPPPFAADFETEFLVSAHRQGAKLRVTQSGFPCSAEGEEFLAACETGWRDTFAGIRRFLEAQRRGR